MRKQDYLYFGIATVLVEWLGLLLGLVYLRGFNPDLALSTATIDPWPVPLIFGVTLTVAGITYAIFLFALRQYSKWIPYWAVTSGAAFIITGWTPYSGNGGFWDIVHQLASYLALFGYLAVIWLLRSHPKRHVQLGSRVVVGIIAASAILSFFCNYVFRHYFAYLQLLILFAIQAWTVLVVWHERKLLIDKKS